MTPEERINAALKIVYEVANELGDGSDKTARLTKAHDEIVAVRDLLSPVLGNPDLFYEAGVRLHDMRRDALRLHESIRDYQSALSRCIP